ncbi:efflux RND transporter periplasmic adaptor subunit [Nitrospinota bacterium]
MKRLFALLGLVGLAGAAYGLYFYTQSQGSISQYQFAKVERGSLTISVSASGTLNAVNTVLVGSQVSGQIKELLADYNSPVRKGQVIARIAPEIFEAKVDKARAEVEVARAEVLTQLAQLEQSRADLDNSRAALASVRAQTAKARVALLDAKRNLKRKAALFKESLISRSDKDATEAAYESALAQFNSARAQEKAQGSNIQAASARLKVAKAKLQAAKAQVKQREASLRQAEADLSYTIIRAPVNGVVVSRNVDVGQTVAASLQAPTLFTIAEDLRQMQVNALVDEADISQIRVSQTATFTVDSFPGRTFRGRVVQVRKAPQVTQNVVTYDVVISGDNPNLRLLPGMTANVSLVVVRKQNILKIPNTALRFNPAGNVARGQRGSAPQKDASDSGAQRNQRGRRRPALRKMAQTIAEKVGLDADQREKLDGFIRASGGEFRALRNLPPDERREKARKIRQSILEKVRGILNPAQQKPYRKLLAQFASRERSFPGRVWVLGEEGNLRAVFLRVGKSDGSFTELIEGSLREGQKVIVRAVSKAGSSVRRRWLRFGF